VKKNPDGARLEDIIPVDLYAQFVAIRDTYAEDDKKIDRLTPLFAADAIYGRALEQTGLVTSRDIFTTADRLARRSDAERVRSQVDEKFDILTFLNHVQAIPMDEQIACLAEVLSFLESHMENLSMRAEIWSDGDVSPLATDAHPPLGQSCTAALQTNEQVSRITELLNAKWLNNVDQALRTHRTTVATLDIAEIIEPDGLVSKLLEKGYEIEGPMRSSTSEVGGGPYLGQTPPGLTAKPFAPGIVNTEEWGDAIVFSQDLNEICVSRWKHSSDAPEPENVIFERTDNAWRKRAAPEGYCGYFPSPDGQTLHYRAKYKVRTVDGWSELKSLGPAFEDIRMLSLSSSAEGTLVFDELGTIIPGVGAKGDGLVWYSRLLDGVREDPTPFGEEINTGIFNAHPFIAPDESYIMWDGERDTGYGNSDVYISFRQQDGSWGEAINLGDKVNTDAEEGGAKITPDGKYLFFNRMVPPANGEGNAQSDLFWIDAQIIEELRPEM